MLVPRCDSGLPSARDLVAREMIDGGDANVVSGFWPAECLHHGCIINVDEAEQEVSRSDCRVAVLVGASK